jgi:hypothetical protein
MDAPCYRSSWQMLGWPPAGSDDGKRNVVFERPPGASWAQFASNSLQGSSSSSKQKYAAVEKPTATATAA